MTAIGSTYEQAGMTLMELRYLVALADSGHFGRAAEKCHVSPPTLSTQVQKLEESLGVTLFERTRRAVKTTPIGVKIVAQARKVLQEAAQVRDLAASCQGPLTGPLRLGIIPTLSPYLLPWLMPPLQRAYPKLELVLRESLTSDLLAGLQHHELDALLLALPVADHEVECLAIFDEPF